MAQACITWCAQLGKALSDSRINRENNSRQRKSLLAITGPMESEGPGAKAAGGSGWNPGRKIVESEKFKVYVLQARGCIFGDILINHL